MDNYILAYYQKITDGSITAGRWIRLLYEKIITGIEDGTYIYDNRKASQAIRFIETFCRHNKGKLAPGPLKLSLWQKAFISCLFGVVDASGLRIFREVALFVGRKCGKTLIASAIMAYSAFIDGEYGGEIYCIAPKLDQSELVYSAFEFTKDQTPDLQRRIRKRKNDYYLEGSNTTIKKIAFNDRKADGYSPTLTVADEMSSWTAARGLRQYEVITSGTGARSEPITLSISSGGYVNDGPYDELVKRGTRFLLGESKDRHLLPVFYMIDDPNKWDDINELQKSIPGMGVSVPVSFILDEIEVARESLSKKTEFLTKYCCIKQSSSLAWLPAQVVETASGPELGLNDFMDSYCVGGVDLSRTTDLSAAVIVIERGGLLYVFAHFFLPSEKIEEATQRDGVPYDIYIKRGLLTASGANFIDYHDVFDWFRRLVEDYRIYPLQVGYDRYSAQYLVQDLQGYGFHCDDVYQGTNLYGVIQETEGLLKDGVFRIGSNDLLKAHLLNSALKMSVEQGRGKLVKLQPTAHIDGAAALLDAMTVRQKYYAEIGEQLKNEG